MFGGINSSHRDDANSRFPATITNAKGHTETRLYAAQTGALLSLTGPNNLTTTWTVDGFGRVETENRADGTRTRKSRKVCDGGCPTGAVMVEITEPMRGNTRTAVPVLTYMDNVGDE